MHSETTVLAPLNDKTQRRTRGYLCIFTVVFSWLSDGSRSVLVIDYYFNISLRNTAATSSGRARGVPIARAIREARAPIYGCRKLVSAVSYGVPPCPDFPSAARVRLRWTVKLRWPVLCLCSLFSLRPGGNTIWSFTFSQCLFWSLCF